MIIYVIGEERDRRNGRRGEERGDMVYKENGLEKFILPPLLYTVSLIYPPLLPLHLKVEVEVEYRVYILIVINEEYMQCE